MNNDKKDESLSKIILFIIGVLVGAVISTTAFLICANTMKSSDSNGQSTQMQQQGGTPPDMPNGQNGQSGQQPPEMPSNNTQSNS